MMENTATAQAIFHALHAAPRRGEDGCLALIGSAHSQSGTSYTARSVALAAAAHFTPLGQRVLLLDYDMYKQSQLQSVMALGAVHGPYDAALGTQPFWQVRAGMLDESPEISPNAYGSLYIQDQTGLAVSVFRWDQIGSNQSVKVISAPNYWAALRQHFAMVIIDAPAMDRSTIAAMLYPYMDACAVVTRPQTSGSPQTVQMSQDIHNYGGHFSGLILNEHMSGFV